MTQIIDKQSKSALQEAFLRYFENSEKLKEPASSFLYELRKNAIHSFEQSGLPGHKHEEYKYTPITRALDKNFDSQDLSLEEVPNPDLLARIKPWLLTNIDANIVVFINGQFSQEHSKIVSSPQDMILKPLSQAFIENKELVEQHFAKQASIESDAFVALNTAFAQEGLFLHVPKGKVVDKPVLVYFINDTTQRRVIVQPRNLYLIGENSQVDLAESFYTVGENPGYQNIVSEIVVAQHAIANYYKIEIEGQQAYHTGTTQVQQAAQSLFNATTVSLSGAMVRNNLNIALDAEHCETHMFGLYMLDQHTHVDNHTIVDHRLPNSFSNELYKGIMDDHSRGVFNGKIYVRPGAQKTNAFQSNMNILLTDDASIDTKPQLEIWADDVKCSHGATTGQIDAEQLFYLRTRGLKKEQARAILLKAFADDVIQNIKVKPLREQLEHIIAARLEKNYQL